MKIIFILSNFIYYISFFGFLILLTLNYKKFFKYLRDIPIYLVIFNILLVIYKIFLLPKTDGGREDYGMFVLSLVKNKFLNNFDIPIYKIVIDFFTKVIGGVTFEFMVNFDIILLFISFFAIYIIVYLLFKNRFSAFMASTLYVLSPPVFIISLTEDYTNLGQFFVVLSLLFAVIYYREKKNIFLILTFLASLLATGSRPEYIVFAFVIILFVLIFFKSDKKIYNFYIPAFLFLLIPRIIFVVDRFLGSPWDSAVHGEDIANSDGLYSFIINHSIIFYNNLLNNILALLNFKELFIFLFIFIVISIFLKNYKNYKKEFIFFFLYFIIIFLYYSFFHNEGFYSSSYKYTPALILPLVILASTCGVNNLSKYYNNILKGIVVLLIFYALFVTSPRGIIYLEERYSYCSSAFLMDEEYLAYRNNEKNMDKNGIFITNGCHNFLFSAIKIDSENINCAYSKIDLDGILDNTNFENKKIYISHGENSGRIPTGSQRASREQFKKIMFDKFGLEKIIIGTDIEKDKYFLYEVSLLADEKI